MIDDIREDLEILLEMHEQGKNIVISLINDEYIIQKDYELTVTPGFVWWVNKQGYKGGVRTSAIISINELYPRWKMYGGKKTKDLE